MRAAPQTLPIQELVPLTSFKTSLEAPRSSMVHALGSLQSTMKVKNSSPIFWTSNRPALVPMSLSLISSALQLSCAFQMKQLLALCHSCSWVRSTLC